jgi:hypothetical protein
MPPCGHCMTRRSRARCSFARSRSWKPAIRARKSSVADLPSAVTDTHALVFHVAGGGRLGARLSRINLRRSVREFFDDLFGNPAYQPLDPTAEHVCVADGLRFNRDSFDAPVCAAARSVDLPLLTRRADIRGAGAVSVIW